MTARSGQRVPLPVSAERDNGRRMAAGRDQDHTRAAAGILTAKPRQAGYCLRSRAAAMPDGPADLVPAGSFATLCDAVAAGADGPAMSSADVAMRDDVAVVRMCGEPGESVLQLVSAISGGTRGRAPSSTSPSMTPSRKPSLMPALSDHLSSLRTRPSHRSSTRSSPATAAARLTATSVIGLALPEEAGMINMSGSASARP